MFVLMKNSLRRCFCSTESKKWKVELEELSSRLKGLGCSVKVEDLEVVRLVRRAVQGKGFEAVEGDLEAKTSLGQ